jgi:hypothetical protein
MNTIRIMKRAYIILLLLWILDLVNLMSLTNVVDEHLQGALMLGALESFLLILILGLLIMEIGRK